MGNKKTCPACGADINKEDVFCNQCGEPLLQTCPNCGEQIEMDAVFCRECGYELNQSRSEATKADNNSTKPIVPVYKKWWFWLCVTAAIIGLVLLFSSGGNRSTINPEEESEEVISDSSVSTESDREETVDPVDIGIVSDAEQSEEITKRQEKMEEAIQIAFPNDPEAKESATPEMKIEEFQEIMETVLDEAFGKDNYEAELDREKKRYNVYVWFDDGTESLKDAQTGDKDAVNDWNSRIGLLMESSKIIKEKLDEAGLSEWAVTLSLLDEDTRSEVYAITKDGELYHEIIRDGKLDT